MEKDGDESIDMVEVGGVFRQERRKTARGALVKIPTTATDGDPANTHSTQPGNRRINTTNKTRHNRRKVDRYGASGAKSNGLGKQINDAI